MVALSRLTLVLSLAVGWLAGAHARTDCPPVPKEPTQQQLA